MISRHHDADRIAGCGEGFQRIKALAVVHFAHFSRTRIVRFHDTNQLALFERSIDTRMMLAQRTGSYDATTNF